MNENEYRQQIDKHFNDFFEIEREVRSTNKKRIDYILKCKYSGVLFGVEVKSTERMRGVDIGKYILQASNYYNEFWKTKFSETPCRVLIFITPAISNFIKQSFNPCFNGKGCLSPIFQSMVMAGLGVSILVLMERGV